MNALGLPRPTPGLGARAVAASISFYQRWISPYKGFHCAHRVAHGGASCSAFAKRLVLRRGVIAAWRRMRVRFAACAAAAVMLHATAASAADERERRWQRDGRADVAAQCCSCTPDPVTPFLVDTACHGGTSAAACVDVGSCASAAACIPF
jgi:putative component of membrane protein insertase Oxa1/YidC/SpoIIIJ protein YidD